VLVCWEHWGDSLHFQLHCDLKWASFVTYWINNMDELKQYFADENFYCYTSSTMTQQNSCSRAWLTLSNAAMPGNILPLRNSHTTVAFRNSIYRDEESIFCLNVLHAAFPTTITSQISKLAFSSIWPNCVAPSENSSAKS